MKIRMHVLLALCLLAPVVVWAQQTVQGAANPPSAGVVQGSVVSGGRNACPIPLWIDPDKTVPTGTHYALYPQPSRMGKGDANPQGSMLVYLPPDYRASKNRRYPVVYFMHGGNQTQQGAVPAIERLDAAIRAGRTPPFIMVAPQALTNVRYINTKDGMRPLEDIIVKDLISYVDSHYRTIPTREARGIEGFSMGGFGSLRLGFKFSDIFGSVSALAPAITEMKDEPPCVREPFGDDQAFYDEAAPWNTIKKNADSVRGRTKVRLIVGDKDRLQPLVHNYSELLASLSISHVFALCAPNVEHRIDQILDNAPYDPYVFWEESFGNIKH